MPINQELEAAIRDVLERINESQNFKNRFTQLIKNYIDNTCRDDDIEKVLELVILPSQGDNSNAS